jgi:hypothetical protein
MFLYPCKIHTYTETPSAFKKSKNGSSTKPQAPYTKNECLNFNEYIIVMEENEREKGDAKEFARLVEQSEQAWKPIKKELQTINISTRQNERELKIEKLITTSKKENLILLLHECIDVFAWFTYICMV